MKRFFACIACFALCGCATTHEDVASNGVFSSFESSQPPGKVAVCISHNSDNYFFSSMVSKIVYTGEEPIKVEMRNGESQFGNVKISQSGQGSKAEFYFSSVGRTFFPTTVVEQLTKGCG
jgi:hypothetical protein